MSSSVVWTENSNPAEGAGIADTHKPSSAHVDIMPHPSRGGDAMSREYFLIQVHREKRRSDRSRAPLSLVIMRLAASGEFDADDQRDILRELSFSMRESDVIGCLGDGIVAFLLPYSEGKAAEAFSKQIVGRTDVPVASVEAATYPDPAFDSLLLGSLKQIDTSRISTQIPERKKPSLLWAKRLIDIVGATFLLILAAPVMLVTAIAVGLTSPGPIIFRQMRVGRGGQPFPFYKFRSMHCDNDDAIHRDYVKSLIQGDNENVNEGDADNPVYKLQGDARVTPVGRIIRRASIDELPQLFNVLKGEMSLVGPRPPIPYEIEDYQAWHMRRLQEVRPGITGLWQVEGRSKTTFDEMVRLDLRYIRNWSLWLDIKILFRTIFVVIRGEGAD